MVLVFTREYLDVHGDSASCYLTEDDIDPDVVSNARWIHFSGEIIMICSDSIRRKAILKMLLQVHHATLKAKSLFQLIAH